MTLGFTSSKKFVLNLNVIGADLQRLVPPGKHLDTTDLEADLKREHEKTQWIECPHNNAYATFMTISNTKWGRMPIKSKIDTISTIVTNQKRFSKWQVKNRNAPLQHQYGYYQTIQSYFVNNLDELPRPPIS